MPWQLERPFPIEIPEPELEELRRRLGALPQVRLSPGAGGVDPEAFARLVDYWREGYDWRAAQDALNALDHVQVAVDGLRLHAVHARAEPPGRRLALILVHGWPSSFVELLPIVDLLVHPERHGGDPADAFDVVIPSLPGYTFSQAPAELRDATAARIAARFTGLMSALGYERFGASGGDVGARVTAWLGAQDPERVVGIHMSSNALTPPRPEQPGLSDEERAWAQGLAAFSDPEGAYSHVQRTKPGTLAVGLGDSPLGLAAWIAEKWWSWSDQATDRLALRDPLLTQVMLYWWTRSIGTSFLTYAATPLPPGPRPAPGSVTVPASVYAAAAEIGGVPPRSVAAEQYNLHAFSEFPRGGHFMATEQPELFAHDVRAFFRPLR